MPSTAAQEALFALEQVRCQELEGARAPHPVPCDGPPGSDFTLQNEDPGLGEEGGNSGGRQVLDTCCKSQGQSERQKPLQIFQTE